MMTHRALTAANSPFAVLGVYETIGDLHMLPYPLPQVTVSPDAD